MTTVITEQNIIAARWRAAAAHTRQEPLDFIDALLASPDLTPDMVREWLDAEVRVHWCACPDLCPESAPRIVCEVCGLPPYWVTRVTPGKAS